MEDSAEFPHPDMSAAAIANEAIDRAKRNEVIIPVLDMKGNKWGYSCMVNEGLTLIKYQKESEDYPAITLRQGESRNSEIVIIAVSIEGKQTRITYGSDGRIKRTEAIDPAKYQDRSGLYESEKLPQNINTKQTSNMLLENLRQHKGELITLVPAKSKVTVVEAKGRTTAKPQSTVRRAA